MQASDWVLVLDLDDTLYQEEDFVVSGILAVAALLHRTYGTDIGADLLRARRERMTDLWGYACQRLGLPAAVKDSLLWAYRLHAPDIALDGATRATLDRLIAQDVTLAILTDGRSLTQRNKAMALGLGGLPLFASEEFGLPKPDPLRFRLVMERWPSRSYAYFGDNPQKDFLAPNGLGWATFCLRDRGRNVHPQIFDGISAEMLPDHQLDNFSEICEYIF